jgi:uncharacterized protein (DUF4415 family)
MSAIIQSADEDGFRPRQNIRRDLSRSCRLASKVARPEQVPDKKAGVASLNAEVIEYFKSTGVGWQSRIDETLRKAVKRKASA